jgi:hypothetical protein
VVGKKYYIELEGMMCNNLVLGSNLVLGTGSNLGLDNKDYIVVEGNVEENKNCNLAVGIYLGLRF